MIVNVNNHEVNIASTLYSFKEHFVVELLQRETIRVWIIMCYFTIIIIDNHYRYIIEGLPFADYYVLLG